MAERPAVNTSPLIVLAKAGCLELLQLVGERIIVPAAVAMEIRTYPLADAAIRALDCTPWFDIVETPPPSPAILAWDLGPGESAVLAWGETHPGSDVIIDDLAARRCASAMGIPLRGTLGLVMLAKSAGRFPSARPILARLRAAGLYLSDRTLDEVMKLVGE